MKVFVYQDNKKEWRWNALARNGQIVACSGEGYKRRATMLKTLLRLRAQFTNALLVK